MNHADQRALLADLGTPWRSLPPAHTYGTLVLACDDRDHHRRLRVPVARADADALAAAVFDDRRWPAALDALHPERRPADG